MNSKVFYKYRPANDYTIALLERQEMKFSYADEYNDPFDSKLVIDVGNDIGSILDGLDATSLHEGLKQVIRSKIESGEFQKEDYEQLVYEALMNHKVMSSCFSGTYKNIILWSHYADSHNGICVGIRDCSSTNIPMMKFNVQDCCSAPNDPHANGLFLVHRVNYSDKGIIQWNPFSNDIIQPFIDAHRNKAQCWEYEDEYRLIVPSKVFCTTILQFDPSYVVEIYLGCCIDSDFCQVVKRLMKKGYLDKGISVRVTQMVLSKDRFALEEEAVLV